MNGARSCGECRLCCFTHGVSELGKGERESCRHLLPRGPFGCAIYAERPRSCRIFDCAWLQGAFEEGDRPDALGVVFSRERDGSFHAIEATVGAGESPRVRALVARLGTKLVLIRHDGAPRVFPGPAPR